MTRDCFRANCEFVHSNVWNACDEWMHLSMNTWKQTSIYVCRWINFNGHGNSGAKISKMHTVGRLGGCGLWHIFDRGVSHVWQRGEGVKFGQKVWHIFWMAPSRYFRDLHSSYRGNLIVSQWLTEEREDIYLLIYMSRPKKITSICFHSSVTVLQKPVMVVLSCEILRPWPWPRERRGIGDGGDDDV